MSELPWGCWGRDVENDGLPGLGIGMPKIVFLRGFDGSEVSGGGGTSGAWLGGVLSRGLRFVRTLACVIVPFVAVVVEDNGREGDNAAGLEEVCPGSVHDPNLSDGRATMTTARQAEIRQRQEGHPPI